MQKQHRQAIWLTAALAMLVGGPGLTSEGKPRQTQPQPNEQISLEQSVLPSEVLAVNGIEQSATTVVDWQAQIEAVETVPITGVRIQAIEAGVDVILETANRQLSEPVTTTEGQTLTLEIPNAVLQLPEGDEFRRATPAAGLTEIAVTNISENRVRVTLTGAEAVPTTTVSSGAAGLTLSVVPGVAQVGEEAEVEITVRAERGEADYNPTNSSTATGTDTPLRDVPLSVQVIPKEVLEDRNVTELGDALETAGGVVPAGRRGTSVFGPNFLIRGFPVSRGFFRDGVTTFSLSPLSTNDIERVEILKGPASVLFGQGDPGGIINLVSKKPLDEPFYEISGTVGSFDTYRGAVDLSGPLSESKNVQYRLNLSYENYGSFRDFVDGERLIISPIVTWDIGPDTSLDIFGQYVYNRETIDNGIPAVGDGIVDIPRNRFLGEDFGEFSQNEFKLGYRLKHDFNEDWSLRNTVQYQQYKPRRFAPLFDSFDEVTGDLERNAYFAGGTYHRFFANTEVTGRFKTGSIQHQVLAGVEYRHDAETPEFRLGISYPSINVFNPVYTGVPYPRVTNFFRDDNVDTISVYLQDQIEIVPQLKVLAGLRYDYVDQFRTVRDIRTDVNSPREDFELRDSAFTPRFGVVYQPIEPVSLYASYTTSFDPSFGASRNSDGSVFEPETGRQFEVGVKADLTDRLSLTLAAFDIRRQNVNTPDPNNPDFSLQTGEVASRGIELNLGGEVLPGWNITGAYTYLDTFVSQDNTDIVGNKLPNVPENQFSLWTTYEIQQGSLEGLGLGLGLFYVDDRQGDLENTFTLPSYFRTDAALFYKRDNWRVQLNFENLFDIEYFTSSAESRLRAYPGAPFGVSASFSINF